MNRIQKVFIALLLVMGTTAITSSAQIVVNVRPVHEVVVRTPPPSPRHVWVDEDWEWRGGHYVWVGGHWIEPPRPGAMWVPGHWRRRPGGWVWIRGHWRWR